MTGGRASVPGPWFASQSRFGSEELPTPRVPCRAASCLRPHDAPEFLTLDLSAFTAGTPDDLDPLTEGRDVRFGHSVSAVGKSSAIERVLDLIIGAWARLPRHALELRPCHLPGMTNRSTEQPRSRRIRLVELTANACLCSSWRSYSRVP